MAAAQPVKKLSPVDATYVAGLIDSEGTITLTIYSQVQRQIAPVFPARYEPAEEPSVKLLPCTSLSTTETFPQPSPARRRPLWSLSSPHRFMQESH